MSLIILLPADPPNCHPREVRSLCTFETWGGEEGDEILIKVGYSVEFVAWHQKGKGGTTSSFQSRTERRIRGKSQHPSRRRQITRHRAARSSEEEEQESWNTRKDGWSCAFRCSVVPTDCHRVASSPLPLSMIQSFYQHFDRITREYTRQLWNPLLK